MKTNGHTLIAVFFYDLFQQLKDQGVPLDNSKFQDFLALFVLGAIDLDKADKASLKEALKDLLIALWVPKTKYLLDFDRLFPAAFEAFYQYCLPDAEAENDAPPKLVEKDNARPGTTASGNRVSSEIKDEGGSTSGQPAPASAATDETSKWRNVQLHFGEEGKGKPLKGSTAPVKSILDTPFIFTDNKHLSIKERQAQQLWRRMRQQHIRQPSDEIDVPQTVQILSRNGYLKSLAYKTEKVSRQHFVLLIDCAEEMAAYQVLIDKFIWILKQSARLTKVEPLFFRQYPDVKAKEYYFYTNQEFTRSAPLRYLEKSWDRGSCIFVLSDGGGINGTLDFGHLSVMQSLCKRLKANFSQVIWFNPLPEERWKNTTADILAQEILCLPIDQKGIERAVRFLKGN
jgi:uncharacterized protein with von Willebrand factor type A (vWA) domain